MFNDALVARLVFGAVAGDGCHVSSIFPFYVELHCISLKIATCMLAGFCPKAVGHPLKVSAIKVYPKVRLKQT